MFELPSARIRLTRPASAVISNGALPTWMLTPSSLMFTPSGTCAFTIIRLAVVPAPVCVRLMTVDAEILSISSPPSWVILRPLSVPFSIVMVPVFKSNISSSAAEAIGGIIVKIMPNTMTKLMTFFMIRFPPKRKCICPFGILPTGYPPPTCRQMQKPYCAFLSMAYRHPGFQDRKNTNIMRHRCLQGRENNASMRGAQRRSNPSGFLG